MQTRLSLPWFKKPFPPRAPKNHWEGCTSSHYINDYRGRLDAIAKKLWGGIGSQIYTRYNQEKKGVEFLSDREGVIAFVTVHGEVGYPYGATIRLRDASIPKELFEETFRSLSPTFYESLEE